MDFKDNLNRLMNEHNVSNRRLAREIGCTYSSVAGWRRGRQPQLRHLSALADYFDVSVDELEGKDG